MKGGGFVYCTYRQTDIHIILRPLVAYFHEVVIVVGLALTDSLSLARGVVKYLYMQLGRSRWQLFSGMGRSIFGG